MAKKKQSLQQLDLFGMFEPSPEPQAQAETSPAVEEPIIEQQEIQPAAELQVQEALVPVIEEQPETEQLPQAQNEPLLTAEATIKEEDPITIPEHVAYTDPLPVVDEVTIEEKELVESIPEPQQAQAELLPVIEEPITEQEAEHLAQAEALPIVEESVSPTAEPEPTQMVFNDGKIGVKIKVKTPITVTTPEPPQKVVAAEPKEKLVTPNQHAINLRKRGRKSFKDMDAEVGLIEVPSDEILNKKLYYSIGEVAGFFKVNPSLIRAWENAFDILKPRKTRKGDRLFRVEDIKNLEMIYYLLRNRKFSIEGAKTYIKNNKKGADTNFQLTQSLKKFKGFLLELKANLAVH